ncbi:MAG: lysylphosphatidylglycerol synthase transmembrane domain-containing protein [Pirellulales bacterium]
MPSRAPRNRRWLVVAAKAAVFAVVAWFVRGTLVEAWRQLGEHRWELHAGWLGAAGAIYALGLLPAGVFWWHLLRRYGQTASLGQTLRAYYVGHLGKYVPGKAMVVVLRAGLIHRRGMDGGLAAASVFVETLTMMAVGGVLAAAMLAVRLGEQRLLFWGAVGLAVVAGLPTLPPICRRLVRLAGVGKRDPAVAARVDGLGWRTLLVGWAAMLLTWLGLAASLWATMTALDLHPPALLHDLPAYLAAVALSMVAGFLSLIPGGLGVRDVILVKLIVRLFACSAAQAALAAGLLRLVWLMAELIVSAMLYGAVRGEGRGYERSAMSREH